MRYLFLLVISIFFYLPLIGQDTTEFKNQFLRDYFRQDLKRKTLDFSFGLAAGAFRSTNQSLSRENNSVNNLRAFYSSFKNSSKVQQSFRASFSGIMKIGEEFSRRGPGPPIRENFTSYDLSLQVSGSNRFYKSSKWYFEVNPRVSLYFTDPGNYDSSSLTIGQLLLGLGKGRIEVVSDAWSAIRIMEDLASTGLIKEDLSDQEYSEFADLLADLRNLRKLDFRMKRVFELEEVGRFLIEKGVVKTDDVLFMAQLSDTYENERFFTRESGSRWLSYLSGRVIGYSERKVSDFNDVLSAGATYYYKKPINNTWQLNLSGGAKAQTGSALSNPSVLRLVADLEAAITYYPNARTNIQFFLYSDLTHQFTDELINRVDPFGLTIGINSNYFLGPFTSFNGSLYYNSNSSIYFNDIRNSKLNVSLGVNHSFF